MTPRLRYAALLLLALTTLSPAVTQAQQVLPAADDHLAAVTPLPQNELDALLAPIALYPDQLLAQVLMASTYPLDVVAAARFVQQNPSLAGDALDQALQDRGWDPSILSLTAYPQVLLMMNDMLDWTERLGQAFLANQQQVMDTVQLLRSRAQAAGNLRSTAQQSVIDERGSIDIEPAQPRYVYVPVYDPTVIYGAWSDPDFVPPYWYPPPIFGYPDFVPGIATAVFFGTGCLISDNHWGWAHPNWHSHGIDVNIRNNYFADRPQYANRWHDGHWRYVAQHASRDYAAQMERLANTVTQPRVPDRLHEPAQAQGAFMRPARQTQLPAAQPPLEPTTRALPQPNHATAPSAVQTGSFMRPPQGLAIARSSVWPNSAPARPTQTPPQAFAHPLHQSPNSVPNVTAQLRASTAGAQPGQPPQQAVSRALPRPQQASARSLPPQPRLALRAMQQPRAPQLAYSRQPRAAVPMNVSHSQAGGSAMSSPAVPLRNRPASVSRPSSANASRPAADHGRRA